MVTTKIRKCHRFRDKDNCYKSRHSLFVSCTLHRIQQLFRNYDSWIFTNITTLRLFLTKLLKVVLSNSSKQSWKFGLVDPEWIVCWDKIKFNDIFVILATQIKPGIYEEWRWTYMCHQKNFNDSLFLAH